MKALIVTLLPSFIQRSFASCFDFTWLATSHRCCHYSSSCL